MTRIIRRLALTFSALAVLLAACGGGDGNAEAFCNFQDDFAEYDGFLSADPDDAATQVGAVRQILSDGISNAPPDIRTEFELAANALSGLIDVFEDSGFGAEDPDPDALQAAFDLLEDPDVAAANTEVEVWFEEYCPAG